MSDIFACRECHAVYTISRQQQPPTAPSRCEICGSTFPPMELGEWLLYQHAEPEWNVQAWLTGAPDVEAPTGRDDPGKGSGQAVKLEDQSAANGNKVLAMLTGRVRKFAGLTAHD
jgi:hypothetical protein